jgi:hypothetical protein
MKTTDLGVVSRSIVRPDARDLYDNSGVSRAGLYRNLRAPWIDPPPGWVLVNRRGSISAPAINTLTLITSFQVPIAMNAIILAVMNVFFGNDAAGNNGSGTITWTIDVNRPIAPASNQLGYSPPDFSAIITQLGSLTQGPWPVPGGILLNEQDFIRYKVTTSGAVGVGAPNFITAAFLGWMWPARLPVPEDFRSATMGGKF